MSASDRTVRTSFEVAEEVAKLLDGLSKAKRKEVLSLVASRDELRVVSMDRPIGRVGAPSVSNKVQTRVEPKAIAKGPSGTKPGLAIAKPSPKKTDDIVKGLQKERDTTVSQLKLLDASPNPDPVEKASLLSKKGQLESSIKERVKVIKGTDSPAK